MTDLMKTIGNYLTPETLGLMANQVGGSQNNVQEAIGAAVPLLINALGRNSANPQGAEAITGALRQDHDGSLLGQLGDFVLGNVSGRQANGTGILEHVLGGRREPVERGVSRASGLDMSQVGRLLPILAPIVMNALGKIRRERDLGTDGVQTLLQREREETGSQLGGFAQLIDSNNDGSIADDLIGIGARLFGGMR